MYFYQRIRDMREDNDLSQEKVAKILGITRQQYQLYESGEKGKYIEFDVGNYDEELTVFFREARDTSKEELDEKDSYFDNFYNDSEN